VKFVLTGGGTGGHVYPAISVARELAGETLLYVGAAARLEARLAPEAGLAFEALPCAPVARRPGLEMARDLGANLRGARAAVRLLRRFQPDAVLGTGGFAGVGVMAAALWLRLPLVILEPNAVPGRANRLLGRWAARIAIGFEPVAGAFPRARARVTGVPIRRGMAEGNAAAARQRYELDAGRPTLLVLGGSGGARSLNQALLAALPQLLPLNVQILHQTGPRLWEESREQLGEAPPGYHPTPYIEAMADALAAADLLLCRGGASTLAEATAAGKPALIVPYPFAATDEQTRNAEVLVAAGAGELLPDRHLTADRLAAAVARWLSDADRLRQAAEASRSLGRPQAAAAVADLLREAARINQVATRPAGRRR